MLLSCHLLFKSAASRSWRHRRYGYLEVGSFLKTPQLPIWVVCSESHFSSLFVEPRQWPSSKRRPQQVPPCSAGGGIGVGGGSGGCAAAPATLQPPLSLAFYDGLARQAGPIALDLSPAPGGDGWSSRLAGAEDRGTWRGRPVPPLECVVETRWPDVRVEWRGSEPLL